MGSATIDRELTSASDNQTSAAIVSAGQVLWPRRSGWQTFTHDWGTTSPTSPVTSRLNSTGKGKQQQLMESSVMGRAHSATTERKGRRSFCPLALVCLDSSSATPI